MKITKLETLRLGRISRTSSGCACIPTQGLIGLGETSYAARAVEAYLHEYVAPRVLGRDPLADRGARRAACTDYLGYRSSGVETRAASAFDLALWDLFGKACGQPLYQLLGGASRARDPHLQHLRRLPLRPRGRAARYRRTGASTERAQGPYEDLDAFLHRADELAHSLLEQGITAMKIWPFDHLRRGERWLAHLRPGSR